MVGVKNRGAFADPVVEDEFEWADSRISSIFLVEHNEDGTHRVPDPALAIVPLGGCIPYTLPAAAVPRGWLLADGTAVSRITYKTYFDAVGTTYGAGDGSLTFNVPDLRQKFPLGKAASGTGATLGETGGAIDHTHSVGSHTHSISSDGGHDHGGTSTTGDHAHSGPSHTHTFSTGTGATQVGEGALPDTSFAAPDHTHSGTTDSAGSGNTGTAGSHSHSISSGGSHTHGGSTGSAGGTSGTGNSPYLALNFIIYVGV